MVGATPASHVRRECPAPGDVIVLLGGRTGRDGIGGATGSSKAHNHESLESCGAEVQKGNAPIERKLQRLFRREDACRMIKRCNDFGAGGVSVAIGELADGLYIDLNKVTKKYEGLDGTELAISESQERMAVALAPQDVDRFIALAAEENLEATPVATVTEEKRLKMVWNGATIVDISRDFLNSNGAEKHQNVHIQKGTVWQPQWAGSTFGQQMESMVGDLNICSKKGLSLWRQPPADPPDGHGGQAAGGRRDHHLLGHGLGLQPLSDQRQPLQGGHAGGGGERHQAGGGGLPLPGRLPDLPGIL